MATDSSLTEQNAQVPGVVPAEKSKPDFVHLHVHTQYSLLQGAIQVDQLIEKTKALGMKAVAMTDMHNLFGAIDFYETARKAGIKPIIGCELHYAPHGRQAVQGSPATRFTHLVVLCKDFKGYQNLCQLITQSYMDTLAQVGQKGQLPGPRAIVDREMLDRWGDGLIVLSGCLRGELSARILHGEEKPALESLLWFKKRFGEDFYLELQDSHLPEQDLVNETLYEWGKKHDVQCVATCDCHYLEPEDGEAHEVLLCIDQGKNLDFDRPKSLVPHEFSLKSPATMHGNFEKFPEALANTLRVAEKCNLEFRFKDAKGRTIYQLPNFRPEGVNKGDAFDLLAYFGEQSRKGLAERFVEPGFAKKVSAPDWETVRRPEYEARLDSEIKMIEKTGFAGYFLIVADFIGWAKKEGIPVGPGRGSGAGSLVAYSLKITDIDPIQFNLLFERFINPERISMPDFDVDFCQERRGEVIDYVARKYGRDNVCQIITFGKLQARAVIKDVGRVLGFSFADSDGLTKLLPDELDITIASALEREARLREKMDADPRTKQVLSYAQKLEGLYRNAGMHAAGVIITEEPVVSYCPLYVSKDGDVVTQFDKDFSESIGLVKFDFLGLKTLTVIDNAVKLIRQSQGLAAEKSGAVTKPFVLEEMDYEDPKVFALISSGDTDGVFQVESSGMKDLCSRIQPNSLEDITAINALYRPGPLGSGMVDDFIDRKHGRQAISYDVEQLAPILKDTYGVILYQEQVMQIARELAGYSLGQADLLRRAMGKKKAEEMAEHRAIFVAGATKNGLVPEKAEAIFDLMAKFAEYGFNKSHSAAYGVLTYQTAYLKTHYPAEFMAALMTTEMDNTDKITKYISDARAHGLPILPPDVNRSQKRFSVEDVALPGAAGARGETRKGIRFGLEAIKGVGGIAVDVILEARPNGVFTSVLDFARRVPTRKVNKKVFESLTLAGGFDSIAEVNRASLFASLEKLLEHAGDEQEERELGQNSLFDSFTAEEVKSVSSASQIFASEAEWPQARKLVLEKQVVGFFISGHPMDAWQKIAENWLNWTTARVRTFAQEKAAQIAKRPAADAQDGGGYGGGQGGGGRFRAPKTEVRLAGLITETKEITTKKGARMAFATLEDLHGKLELIFFPEAYTQMAESLKRAGSEAEAYVFTADLEHTVEGAENPKLLVKAMEPIEQAHKGRVQQVVLKLNPSAVTAEQMRELKRRLLQSRGKCPVRIEFKDAAFRTRMDLPRTVGVTASPELVESINKVFGESVVSLQ